MNVTGVDIRTMMVVITVRPDFAWMAVWSAVNDLATRANEGYAINAGGNHLDGLVCHSDAGS